MDGVMLQLPRTRYLQTMMVTMLTKVPTGLRISNLLDNLTLLPLTSTLMEIVVVVINQAAVAGSSTISKPILPMVARISLAIKVRVLMA